MAEHESAFAAAVAAVRPLLLGGTIRDAERIVLAVLRAANAADGAELAAANERAETAERRDAIQTEAIRAAKGLARCWQQLAEEAQARLAELGEAETEQRIVTPSGLAYEPTLQDLENQDWWLPGVRLEERQVYPTPWRVAADATAAALSATETGAAPPKAADSELECERPSAGPQEATG